MAKLVVVDKAILKCTVGSTPTPLTVTQNPLTQVNGAPVSTILDNVPGANIKPFGVCAITGGHCVPAPTGPWQPGESSVLLPSLFPILSNDSILPCGVGGTIQVLNPGQSFFLVDPPMPVSESEGPGLLKEGASIGIDMIPFAGWGKGAIEAFKGKDLVTGSDLAWWERGLGIIPGGKYVKRGGDAIGGAIGGIKRIIKGGGKKAGKRGAREGEKRAGKEAPVGRRRRNRIPDRGQPGTIEWNGPRTTAKKYGKDGWPEKEFNKGHSQGPEAERGDHIHDYTSNPHHPKGAPTRQPGRQPTPQDYKDFGIDPSS